MTATDREDPEMPQARDEMAKNEMAKQSSAHQRSAFAIIDPLYAADRLQPPTRLRQDAAALWLYGEAELECWRLAVLRRRVEEAELQVGYPGVFHQAADRARFRCSLQPQPAATVRLRAIGALSLRLDGEEIYRSEHREQPHRIPLPATTAAAVLELGLHGPEGEPPGLLIADGPLATGSAAWLWSCDGQDWSPPVGYVQTLDGEPPHRLEPTAVAVRPVSSADGLFDFGRELLGRIRFRAAGAPQLQVGESAAEALSAARPTEQSTALVSDADGCWTSAHPLALRYARIAGEAVGDVTCEALAQPLRYRGAFACSDQRLTRIWMHAAYTLRLCMHDFLIDGIKRDRLPWTGDLAVSLLANAYSFGEGEIVRRSLSVLARAGIEQADINGIADYSLWWLINEDLYQRYFLDPAHLERVWPRIHRALAWLQDHCLDDGRLQPRDGGWLFIDWVDCAKGTALQSLWYWALQSAARLAERVAEPAAAEAWRAHAARLQRGLGERAWDPARGCWRGEADPAAAPSRHASLLAVLAGLEPPAPGALAAALRDPDLPEVGTPYMKGLECLALDRLGESVPAQAEIARYWGGMLELGATTFWEAYDPRQRDEVAYAFYGRPFGKSLCHAWSASPCQLLPAGVLGIRPSTDGWRSFRVEPRLGELDWACATVPTPQGEIRVEADREQVVVHVPQGSSLRQGGQRWTGPIRHRWRQALHAAPDAGR